MSRLFKNIIYNFFGQGLLVFLGFISVKYIYKQLGKDVLGIIFFTAMVNTIITSVSQMGITSTIVREISAHHKSEPEYIHGLIRTSTLFFWSIYVILAIIIYFFSPYIAVKWINLQTLDKHTAIFMLRVLGIASVIALPKSLYISLFRGLQRMEFNNAIEVITTGLQQLGVILILAYSNNIKVVVYWYSSCYFIRILIYIQYSSRFFPTKALSPWFSLDVIKRNFFFTSRMMLSTIISISYMQVDKIIISKIMPISSLGYYSLVYNTTVKARMITGAVAQAVYPSFSSLHKSKDRHNDLMRQYHKLQDLICFGMVPVYCLIIFAFLPVFSYILNQEIAKMLLLPLTILCVGAYMQTAGIIPHFFSLAVGKPEIPMRINLCVFIFNLPITFVLIYKYGLVGAALSLFTSRIISWFYGVPKICKKCLKIPTMEWYRHIIRIVILAGLTYGISWAVIGVNGSYSILNLSTAFIISTFVFILGAFFMIGLELRMTINRYFQYLITYKVKANPK